jgi:precorrin-2 dehydrogenase/sirohydrochlorin ferrochelatase
MKKYYPVFLKIEEQKCVVVGGGRVAARKAKSLADAGAKVKVVSPEFCMPLLRLAKKADVVLEEKRFRARDLDGAFLTIACTDDNEVNERVCAAARTRGILVNVVDSPQQCDFIVPSVVSRGALNIATSTSGVSPALARRIRQDLEKRYGKGYADFLALMEKSRGRVLREVRKTGDRRRIFEALTAEDFLGEFLEKDRAEAKKLFEQRLDSLLSSERSNHV